MPVDSKMSATAVMQRYESLEAHQRVQASRWRDIADLFWPAKSDILRGYTTSNVDRSRTLHLYDGTGLRARRLLAGNIQAAVTNPSLRWFRLRFRQDELNTDFEVAPWLAEVDDRMLLAYNSSNFYAEAFQHYAQLGVFGTAATFVGMRQDLFLEQGLFALRFQTLYPGSYVVAESQDSQVDTLMRVLRFTPRQAMQKWGNEVSDRVKRIMHPTTGQPSRMDEYEPYLHAVMPRADRRFDSDDNRDMPFADVTIDMDTKDIVDERGWEEFPFLVSRWEREGISAWGYGPGHEALPSAQSLNLLKEYKLQMEEFSVKPPLQILNGGLTGNLRFAPLAQNIVEVKDAVSPINLQGSRQEDPLTMAELKKEIRDAFHVDDLLALPPPNDAGRMTATEVSQRIALMQQFMGPVFTMLMTDYLDPLADRAFGLMLRAGALPEIPEAVLEAAQETGNQIDVEYDGPLARSQRISEVQAFDDLLTLGQKVQETTGSPEWQDNFDLDEGLRKAAEVLGIRRDLARDPRQVRQIRATRQQQRAAAEQAAVVREDAAAFKQGAEGVAALNEVAA